MKPPKITSISWLYEFKSTVQISNLHWNNERLLFTLIIKNPMVTPTIDIYMIIVHEDIVIARLCITTLAWYCAIYMCSSCCSPWTMS